MDFWFIAGLKFLFILKILFILLFIFLFNILFIKFYRLLFIIELLLKILTKITNILKCIKYKAFLLFGNFELITKKAIK